METRLNELKPGQKCVVERVEGSGSIRRRLFDMGITPGADIYIRKVAPLGDPVELTLRGYELSIRKAEAEVVIVEVMEG